MTLRGLLALLFTISGLVLLVFVGLLAIIFWSPFGGTLPAAEMQVIHRLLIEYALAAFLLNALVFLLLFLLLDRIFIRPVKFIVQAMQEFAEHRAFTPLPMFSQATVETRTLGKVFVDFTNNVEQVHVRDMEISRVKSDFISTAAHQLRTPLTGIRWALEALQKEQLTEEQAALVKSAVDKSHDLVGVVGTLLDISSIESGKHKYQFEPTDLQALTAEVAADFAHMAEEKKVSAVYINTGEKLPLARADRQQVKWVLNNLIENAIRYTPAGGGVRITTELAPGRVQIKVHDTGIGITAQDRNNIFERFYRAGNAIAKENAGNGLGLYIARTIATDHGGDLNFEANTDGPGTTFTLSIPTVDAAAAQQ